jgi:hypothetical protein
MWRGRTGLYLARGTPFHLDAWDLVSLLEVGVLKKKED